VSISDYENSDHPAWHVPAARALLRLGPDRIVFLTPTSPDHRDDDR
jgi:hypothetical protein